MVTSQQYVKNRKPGGSSMATATMLKVNDMENGMHGTDYRPLTPPSLTSKFRYSTGILLIGSVAVVVGVVVPNRIQIGMLVTTVHPLPP